MAETPDDKHVLSVAEERRAEARANLRKRFPEMSDEDFDKMSREETETGKFETFVQWLMEKYEWRRGVCEQQLGMGTDDIKDC